MPVQVTPLINGKSYNWASIKLLLGGIMVTGVTRINYSDSEVKQDNFGAGNRPVSRGYGNVTSQCSFSLHAEEVEALMAKAPNKRLNDFGVFDITVQYLVGTAITTHVIRNCEFMGNGRDVSQGATVIETSFDVICSHIDWNK